jgi:hypothetical protein
MGVTLHDYPRASEAPEAVRYDIPGRREHDRRQRQGSLALPAVLLRRAMRGTGRNYRNIYCGILDRIRQEILAGETQEGGVKLESRQI